MEQDLDRRFYNYLSDTMTDDERRVFEQEIASDEDLKKELKEYRLGYIAGKRLQHLETKDRVGQIMRAADRKIKLRKMYVGAAAASVLALVTIGINFLLPAKNVNEIYYAQYYEAPLYSGIKGIEDEVDFFDLAQRSFADSNYIEALTRIDQLPMEEQILPNVRRFKAHSYMAAGQFESAIEIFKELIQNDDPDNQTDDYWYLGMAYLGQGDIQSTISALQKVVDSKNYHRQKSNARELISKLD